MRAVVSPDPGDVNGWRGTGHGRVCARSRGGLLLWFAVPADDARLGNRRIRCPVLRAGASQDVLDGVGELSDQSRSCSTSLPACPRPLDVLHERNAASDKKAMVCGFPKENSTPGRIRTYAPRLRRTVRYPSELRPGTPPAHVTTGKLWPLSQLQTVHASPRRLSSRTAVSRQQARCSSREKVRWRG